MGWNHQAVIGEDNPKTMGFLAKKIPTYRGWGMASLMPMVSWAPQKIDESIDRSICFDVIIYQ